MLRPYVGASPRALRGLLAVAVAAGALWSAAAPASALTLAPPKPNVFFGVSDRGSAADFEEFSTLMNKRPAVLATFHPWGNSLNRAYERWRETATRPLLHIATTDDQTLAELITPQEIALGQGDNYLLQLNFFFSARGLPAYIRPLGEPNRCRNAWSAVTCDGKLKGGEHSTYWYKQAFRRIAAVVRGGGTLEEVNATLAGVGLPPLNRTRGPNPTSLPAAPVAIVWSPLPGGSPRVKGNYPGNYWPGSRWVDWAATDIYSKYPVWKDLNRFFRAPHWRNKPFALAEWGIVDKDDPRFVRRLIAWIAKRQRVRMFIYYTGFGPAFNPYDVKLYPRSLNTLRWKVRRPNFLQYADYNAGTLPPLPKPTPQPTP